MINGLVDKGNTVIVIEHNLDVIKTADHVIDMGPEGGSGGGLVIAEGTPEQVAADPDSYTGQFLAPILAGRAARENVLPATPSAGVNGRRTGGAEVISLPANRRSGKGSGNGTSAAAARARRKAAKLV